MNQAAFSVPESLLGVQKGQAADDPKSLASAQRTDAALESVRETASKMASAMAIGEMSALHVDRVEVTRSGIPIIVSTGPSTVARVDLTISRHVKEDDVDWVEVIPHEITLDVSGNIQSVTAIDLEWRNAHSAAEDLPVPATEAGVLASGSSSATIAPSGASDYSEGAVSLAAIKLTGTQKTKIVDYALRYALSPNRSYKLYNVDCTNFVSQAMLAGGWREVSHLAIDYRWDNAWWYGGIPTNSWTWSGAENFYRMAIGSNGLHRTTALGNVYQLVKGDILQYKSRGASTMTHSMIVTHKAVGTYGTPYLSYHTTNTKNKPFSAMAALNVTWFAHRT